MSGSVSNVTATLRGFNQTWAADVDVLLVGPGGQKMILMSDAGSNAVNGLTLTFSDAAATLLPPGVFGSGTYRPMNYTDDSSGGDNFPSPAPAGPYGTNLAVFNGTPPNGAWSLYVFDDGPGDTGTITNGWSLTITTQPSAASNTPPTVTAISNQVVVVNTATAALAFTIGDAETAASNLVVSVFTSNSALAPTNKVVLGGSGASRTVTVTPTSNQLGSATISLSVSDGTLSASNSFVLTVNPASLTVTENSLSRGYGVTNPVLTGSISGLQAGDVITASFSSSATTNSPVGAYPITFTFSDPGSKLGNYVITTNNGTLTVTNALLAVTANSTNKIYGGTRTFAGTEFTLTGGTLFNGNTLTNVTLASAGTNGGAVVGSYAITATNAVGVGLTNYAISYTNGTLTVTPAALTVAANSTNKIYGVALTPATFTAVGLLNGDSVTSVTLSSSGSASNAAAGSYAINAGGAQGVGLTNYTMGYSNGTLTVGMANLLITAGSTNKVYGATLNPVDYTAAGLLNGDSVTNVTLTSSASVSNAAVGSYAITAGGALGVGLTNYAITYSNATLTVTQAVLIATADNQSRAYGQPNPVFTISYTGFVNGEGTNVLAALPAASSSATSTSAPGNYVIATTGGTDDNYAFNRVDGSLTVAGPGPVTITSLAFLSPASLRIAGTGDANVSYKIEASSDLSSWTEIGTALADGGGAFEFVDEATAGFAARYYRIALP